MTKKHFQKIALMLHAQRENMPPENWEKLVGEMAGVCKEMNPRFNGELFRDWCRFGK